MERSAHSDIEQLIQVMQLSSADGEALKELADEAVAKFDSDTAAIQWFESEVRSRHPHVWRAVKKMVARRRA